jgi:acetate kinase
VHGGSQFIAPAKLDRKTIDELALLKPTAPLHQEACLEPARSLLSLRPATDCAGWGRELDLEANDGTVGLVSPGSSSVEIRVILTSEEIIIARHVSSIVT